MKSSLPLLAAAIMLVAALAHAQERAAGSALETQMTWSALSSQIGTLKTQVNGVDSRVTAVDQHLTKVDQRLSKVEYCSAQGLVYAPGTAGADSHGCITADTAASVLNKLTTLTQIINSNTTTVNKVLQCGQHNQVSDGQSCISITSTPKIDYDKCEKKGWKDLYGFCPENMVFAGATTRNSDTGEWNNFYCCPFKQ